MLFTALLACFMAAGLARHTTTLLVMVIPELDWCKLLSSDYRIFGVLAVHFRQSAKKTANLP